MKLSKLKTTLSLLIAVALPAGLMSGCQPPQKSPTSPTGTTDPTDPTYQIDGDLPPYTIYNSGTQGE